MDICIIVATHKKYKMPQDSMYLPVQSGSALYPNLGYQRDDEGENISNKNTAYNIMCVKYWAWKNLEADYIGITHYRRHFTISESKEKKIENVITEVQLKKILKKVDIILSPKRYYPFFTIESHYTHTKGGYIGIHKRDLEVLREVIFELHPDYSFHLETVLKRNFYHSGSLFIMKRLLYNKYCEFIFSIGDELEKRLKQERPDLTRYIASMTELLIDVWILKNNYDYKEIGLIDFERPNFIKKTYLFLRRMITGYYKGTIKYIK